MKRGQPEWRTVRKDLSVTDESVTDKGATDKSATDEAKPRFPLWKRGFFVRRAGGRNAPPRLRVYMTAP